jgi:DNA-directed RNA polymerase specialized sigma24 family protein
MSEPEHEFGQLMERVRLGCPAAVREVLQRYGGHIRAVVRAQLHHRLRPQFDSIDFQQDVWASFFCGAPKGYKFKSPEALIRFLSEMAHNKVVEVFRARMLSFKHDLNRECSLDHVPAGEKAPEIASRHPTPSQVAMAKEEWDRLLNKQPVHHRRILELLRLGHTHEEIARQLCLSSKMVQRVIHSLKQQRGKAS